MRISTPDPPALPNGAALAALVAAGAGCFFMGALYTAATASPALGKHLIWYAPSGALSGMAALSVLLWLLTWMCLARLWAGRQVAVRNAIATAALLLIAGVLLTFPPVARLF